MDREGRKVPSLPVLARLAHALDMSLAEILRTSASSRLSRGSLRSRLGQERLNAEGSQLRIVRLSGKPGSRGKAHSRSVAVACSSVHQGRLSIDVDGSVFELDPTTPSTATGPIDDVARHRRSAHHEHLALGARAATQEATVTEFARRLRSPCAANCGRDLSDAGPQISNVMSTP